MYVLIEKVEFCFGSIDDWRDAIPDPEEQRRLRLDLRAARFPVVFSARQADGQELLVVRVLYCRHMARFIKKDHIIPHDFTIPGYTDWKLSTRKLSPAGTHAGWVYASGKFGEATVVTDGLAQIITEFAGSA